MLHKPSLIVIVLIAASLPQGLTTGPDGNVWFTDEATDMVARI
jgi:hypothetical protein